MSWGESGSARARRRETSTDEINEPDREPSRTRRGGQPSTPTKQPKSARPSPKIAAPKTRTNAAWRQAQDRGFSGPAQRPKRAGKARRRIRGPNIERRVHGRERPRWRVTDQDRKMEIIPIADSTQRNFHNYVRQPTWPSVNIFCPRSI